MNTKAQQHVENHIKQVLENCYHNSKKSSSSKTENDIVYKHLKLFVRWYAQIDKNGKDSYDYKKNDPLKVMSTFGMSNSLLVLFKRIYQYKDVPHSPELFSIICKEYHLVGCESLIPKLSTLLKKKKTIKRQELNGILSPIVYYEHMTPTDVIVKELLENTSSEFKIPSYYYVLMIKKEQQLKLDSKDSKLKSRGTASERLEYLKDRKASEIEILDFNELINNL